MSRVRRQFRAFPASDRRGQRIWPAVAGLQRQRKFRRPVRWKASLTNPKPDVGHELRIKTEEDSFACAGKAYSAITLGQTGREEFIGSFLLRPANGVEIRRTSVGQKGMRPGDTFANYKVKRSARRLEPSTVDEQTTNT